MAHIIKWWSKKPSKVVELADGTEKSFKEDAIDPQNPPKYELCEDMANMTYLSEATVVYNLKARYELFLIYTYSGLFCVTVNPYKMLPVYDKYVVPCYRGKRKTEMPPHLWSVADNAYSDMLINRKNQSMLITGESGAGKTVNTKKVLSYFALVAAMGSKSSGGDAPALQGGGTLEDQIVAANPAMEAFGNAKTIRNDNSSRFGKFIRIHFGTTGKLSSGDIDTYLLEKSRVIFQQTVERDYHIFYQICSGARPDINEMCKVSTDPTQYRYCAMGEITVKSIDDSEELAATDDSFDVLGFSKGEKDAVYKIVAGLMHGGNMKFKQKPREEQAEADGLDDATLAAEMLGIDAEAYTKALCNPRVKVGGDYVTKGQTLEQVNYALGALTKAIFERLFNWIVAIVNRALSTDLPRATFIGILDIAGFEIFDLNSFEQLCINYTNEKLQQFFNHHMFILEQEEYKREGIDWVFIDFGMDLEATINLIERPLGVLSMLEEECIVPKATDMTYRDKLLKQHLGKCPQLIKPRNMKRKFEAHFEICHYAGTVGYNVTDWLLKNKDPLNNSVVQLFKSSTEAVVRSIWESYVSPEDAPKGGKGKGGKRAKGGAFVTVSGLHREGLNRLLTNLRSTDPHFVRCIIPNEFKRPGFTDCNLVLHQLRCNGVLEGIRICRKGFPSRVVYDEFKQRYRILDPNVCPDGPGDCKKATEDLMASIAQKDWEGIDKNWADNYRFGHTKIFFRAGMLGQLEDFRDDKISTILTMFQTRMRYNLARKAFLKKRKQRDASSVIQANFRSFDYLKDWEWMKLIFKIKPLVEQRDNAKEMKQMAEDYKENKEKLEKETKLREEYQKNFNKMQNERNDLRAELDEIQDVLDEAEFRAEQLHDQKVLLEEKIALMKDSFDGNTNVVETLQEEKENMQFQIDTMQQDLEKKAAAVARLAEEKRQLEKAVSHLEEDINGFKDQVGKMNVDKDRMSGEAELQAQDLQALEEKCTHLTLQKCKLEDQHQATLIKLDAECKAHENLQVRSIFIPTL